MDGSTTYIFRVCISLTFRFSELKAADVFVLQISLQKDAANPHPPPRLVLFATHRRHSNIVLCKEKVLSTHIKCCVPVWGGPPPTVTPKPSPPPQK